MPLRPRKRGKGKGNAKKEAETKPKRPTKRVLRVLRNLENSRLLSLPVEIHTMIFRHLDRCSSTSLALTTKILYLIHFRLRGKVPLNAFWIENLKKARKANPRKSWKGKALMELLQTWMSKRSLEIYMAPRGEIGLRAVSKMITKDKKTVGGLELVGLSAQKQVLDEEWRRRDFWGEEHVEKHKLEEWFEERYSGKRIARKQLRGYEENGIWFYA